MGTSGNLLSLKNGLRFFYDIVLHGKTLFISNQPMISPRLAATIHVGASAISMIVISEDGEILDFLEKPAPLAHDIFGNGKIRRETIERSVAVIHGFQQALKELSLGDTPIRAVATNTLSEASNGDVFLNRLRIACHIDLEALDDGEMTRLVFLKTRRRLLDTPSMRKRNTIVAHVGPGNTRILLFRNGQVIRYNSYRLGTHRTWETIGQPDLLGKTALHVINDHVSNIISQIYYDFSKDNIEDIVIIGHEVQLLSPFLSKPNKTKSRLRTLQQLTLEVASATEDDRVKNYQLDYQTAGSVVPALTINLAIAEIFEVTSVRVSPSDYQHGLLSDLAQHSQLATEFRPEVIRSAKHLGKRYRTDPKHAAHVTFLALRFFEETQALHQLTEHDKFLLEIAAILHEVGNFISSRQHHEHSLYIILQSEIFGLSYYDKELVGIIARYHRGPSPHLTDEHYSELSSKDQLRIAKLASLLRVADAFERTHSQRVKNMTVVTENDRLLLKVEGIIDATAERLALPSKGNLFEELFGLQLIVQEN